MSSFALEGRARLSIELALTAQTGDARLHRQQELAARGLGMSGAEIDAARSGRSFDVQTSIAILLALDARDGADCAQQRGRAERAGIDEKVCGQITDFVHEIALTSPGAGARHA